MIYEYYISLYMTLSMQSPYLESQGLQLTWDKIFILKDENGVRVETKTFFSLPFDLILRPFVENLNMLYDWKPGMRGKQPFDPVAVFKAILFAKLNKNMSDRELERHLLRNPHVAEALGFDKVPSHQTFSHFKRERLTIELLEEIFNNLRDYLVKSGIIDFSSVTIDSAPILAFANLAKANREVKLDDS
ncbi:MAG: transposase, partial [Promethearchaeota archaeon]